MVATLIEICSMLSGEDAKREEVFKLLERENIPLDGVLVKTERTPTITRDASGAEKPHLKVHSSSPAGNTAIIVALLKKNFPSMPVFE